MKKGSNPLPPEGVTKPSPPPAPPAKRYITEGVRIGRKLSRKVRKAYVKQAQKDVKEILEKACEWPFKQRLRLAVKILRGRR